MYPDRGVGIEWTLDLPHCRVSTGSLDSAFLVGPARFCTGVMSRRVKGSLGLVLVTLFDLAAANSVIKLTYQVRKGSKKDVMACTFFI